MRCNVGLDNLARPGLAVRMCIAMVNTALTNPQICSYIRMTCAAALSPGRALPFCASLTRHLCAESDAAQRARFAEVQIHTVYGRAAIHLEITFGSTTVAAQ